MSHNILKVNTNSFDRESNQALSTSHSSSESLFCSPLTNTGTRVYPRSPATGQNYLFYTQTLTNNITNSTVNYYTTNWLESITLSDDGVYRLNARSFISCNASSSITGSIGTYWYDTTNSVILGNSTFFQESAYNYPYFGSVTAIVEVSGAAKTVAVRLYNATNLNPAANYTPQWYDNLHIERLQG